MKKMRNKNLLSFARALRKNMTKEERRLWYEFLSGYPVRFMRQKIIGMYIADFYCAKAKLVIELDGAQHYEEAKERDDAERTAFLAGYGLKVVRISNVELEQNFQGVCEYIDAIVRERIRRE